MLKMSVVASRRSGLTEGYPNRQRQVATGSSDFDGSFEAEKVRIVGAVVERDGKFLMVERLKRSRGFFEFPGTASPIHNSRISAPAPECFGLQILRDSL